MKQTILTEAKAEELLSRYVISDWLKKHSIAAGAVMRGLARRLGQDEGEWAAIGMVHDLDFDLTQDPEIHGLKTVEILKPLNVPEEHLNAIKAHNAEGLGVERKTVLDYALTCGETITGLIVATALVMPDKKLSSVKPSSVVKRMKKKDFARKVSRDNIMLCEKIGLDVDEFSNIAVISMREVADRLGL
ncbi:MAG: HD domain-containing protein [Spirochaetes bacterium]|nr:HD domain-containing protein [Spirochaetota bacterium]